MSKVTTTVDAVETLGSADLAEVIAKEVAMKSDSEIGSFVALLSVYKSLARMFPAYGAFAAQLLADAAIQLDCVTPTHPNQAEIFH